MIESIIDVLIIIVLSFIGFKVLDFLKVPIANPVGPMIFVMAGNLLGLDLQVPNLFQFCLSIGIGIVVGLQFSIKFDTTLVKQLIMSASWMIVTGLLIGFLLLSLNIEANTAFLAAMPGALNELAFISLSFDANPFQVTLFHVVRVVTIITVIPLIVKRFSPASESRSAIDIDKQAGDFSPLKPYDWPLILVLSIAFSLLLGQIGMPIYGFLGTLIVTVIYTKKRKLKLRINKSLNNLLFSCVGGVIGARITIDSLLYIPNLIVPLLVVDALVLLSSVLLGEMLFRHTKMDRSTSYLAAAPGGLGTFILISEQMNADTSRVAIFHLCRYLSMIVFAIVQGMIISHLG